MLHKGMAIIARNQDELNVLAQALNKSPYRTGGLRVQNLTTPHRISINTDGWITHCDDLNWPVNKGITEVVEASVLFRNQLIAERRRQNAI